eukprot:snap_masked-scaffold_45-processed-gene-1.69-mRNA-1 protein AED:1.00 eAED:1.00 QI:0/0/0/0/1/1/2/0/208
MSQEESEVFCDLPLIQECNSTVFEYYDSAAEGLRIFGVLANALLVLALIGTLFSYLRHNLHKLFSNSSGLPNAEKTQEIFLMKHNLFVLFFLILGNSLFIIYSYNGCSLDLDFDSTEGRLNALAYSEGYSSLYLGHFFFQPTLRNLMGVSEDIYQTRRLNMIFYGVICFNILKVIPLAYILFNNLVSFVTFFAIVQVCFGQNFINGYK